MAANKFAFDDFLRMTVTSLQDYLSLRGLSKSGKKQELVARAFGAHELNVPIKFPQETISMELNKEYKRRLTTHNAPDPKEISADQWIDDVSSWPDLDEGRLFSFILKHKAVDSDYIGKYKDQKAYSFYESGFVGALLTYTVPGTKKLFVKGDITPSTKVRDDPHKAWILCDIPKKGECEILTTWCTCVAGSSLCCNHIIALMYKLNYAYKKGYVNPACTSIPQGWNKGTRREVTPKRISELFIRNDSCKKAEQRNRPPINSKAKQNFDPRHLDQQQMTNERVSELFCDIKLNLPNASLLYSVDDCLIPELVQPLREAAVTFMLQPGNAEKTMDELVLPFLEALQINDAEKQKIEEETRDQHLSEQWRNQRLGRITASIIHDVMTKTESIIANRRKNVSPKYSPLVDKIVNGNPDIGMLDPVKWGKLHEDDAIKTFMAEEATKHEGGLNNVRKCGLLVKIDEPFLGASPDGLFSCKCCGTAVLEAKCPYNIKDQNIKENYEKVDFLEMCDSNLRLKRSHRYYSQLTTEIALKGCSHGFIIVWTTVDCFIEKIPFDEDRWKRLHDAATFFFKGYILPVLLGRRELCQCPKCNKVVLESEEIDKPGEQSVCCDHCNIWWHWHCAGINKEEELPDVFVCPSCIFDIVNTCNAGNSSDSDIDDFL